MRLLLGAQRLARAGPVAAALAEHAAEVAAVGLGQGAGIVPEPRHRRRGRAAEDGAGEEPDEDEVEPERGEERPFQPRPAGGSGFCHGYCSSEA